MPLGPVVRRLFGPYEHGLTEAYRGFFIDLDEFAKLMHAWVPGAQRILEVGCGEGAMTERITRTYPNASVTAIDITPRLGRLYRGPTSNVTFSQETVESVARREPAAFDLVVLVDVVHHVPVDARESLMSAIAQVVTPGGSLVIKEWVISSNPIHWLCDMSDRYLTGDDVVYFTVDSINTLLTRSFGPDAIRQIDTVHPWKNNMAVLIKVKSPTYRIGGNE